MASSAKGGNDMRRDGEAMGDKRRGRGGCVCAAREEEVTGKG